MVRWVSDFAAKSPEGHWIKVSILAFCLALGIYFSLIIRRYAVGKRVGAIKAFWLILATLMIGGLLMVILFDMSASQYARRNPSWFAGVMGAKPVWEQLPDGTITWARNGNHQLGFQLFVVGFFLSAISLALIEYKEGNHSALGTTGYLIILAGVFLLWLFTHTSTIAGVPQRALLLLIFFWLARGLVDTRPPAVEPT